MEKQKTKVGKFLQSLGSGIEPLAKLALDVAGSVTGIDQLSALADKIGNYDKMTPQDKETALALIDLDKIELKEITERWKADMQSDALLPKIIRPSTLGYLLLLLTFLVMFDSGNTSFTVKERWIDLVEMLLTWVFLAYFGGRSVEKIMKTVKSFKTKQ